MAVMTSALTGCLELGFGPCWAFCAVSNHRKSLTLYAFVLVMLSCAVPPRKQLEADGSLLVCVEFVKAGSADERRGSVLALADLAALKTSSFQYNIALSSRFCNGHIMNSLCMKTMEIVDRCQRNRSICRRLSKDALKASPRLDCAV